MNSFTDLKKRTWQIVLTVALIRHVRQEIPGVELGKLLTDSERIINLMFEDRETFAVVIWLLCEDQAKEQSINEKDFFSGMDGPTLEAASEALMYAAADFSPRSKLAQTIKKGMGRMWKVIDEKAVTAAEKELEKIWNEHVSN